MGVFLTRSSLAARRWPPLPRDHPLAAWGRPHPDSGSHSASSWGSRPRSHHLSTPSGPEAWTIYISFYVGNCCPLNEIQPGVPLFGGRLPVELLLAPALRDVAAAAVAVALAAADAAVLVSKQSQQILGLLRLFVPTSHGAGAEADASLSPK